jgi:hypothetical protein
MFSDKANLTCLRHWLARLHILAVGCTTVQPDRMSLRALVHFGPLALPTRTADAGAHKLSAEVLAGSESYRCQGLFHGMGAAWPCGGDAEVGFFCPERILTAARYTTFLLSFPCATQSWSAYGCPFSQHERLLRCHAMGSAA